MQRPPPGTYVEVAAAGERFQAFVPAPRNMSLSTKALRIIFVVMVVKSLLKRNPRNMLI
jgi:hypothetical protein